MTEIEHRHLRSAIEYAVLIAVEGQKRRPPLAFPKDLKQFLTKRRLPSGSLGRVRRIIESDQRFRDTIAACVLPELVDDVGRLWLTGASGWEAEAARFLDVAAEADESSDVQRDLKRSERRREAAEHAAARVQADVLVREQMIAVHAAEIDDLRADVQKAQEALSEVRVELIDTRNELRHARDREAAAVLRADRATRAQTPEPPPQRMAAPESADAASVAVQASAAVAEAQRRLGDALDASKAFTEELQRLLDHDHGPLTGDDGVRTTSSGDRSGRMPIPLPGGVISTSAEAAAHLLGCDAAILVDGYNVAKLGWPNRPLPEQREALTARVENLARRHGADITIVFDGDSVVGAHATRRRIVRVVFSPTGVSADDVIRAELAHLPMQRQAVVVTNDREIIDDVRREGANVIPSNAFFAVL